jgi:hypothetical protein
MVVFVPLLLDKLKSKNENYNEVVAALQDCEQDNSSYDSYQKVLIKCILQQIKNEGTHIDTNIELMSLSGEQRSFASVVGRKSKFVMFFSDKNCSKCVEDQVKKLNLVAEKIGKENILLLSSFGNLKDMLIFKNENNISSNNFFNTNSLGLQLENFNTPFFFMIDGTLNINKVFVPQDGLPELDEMYLEIIVKGYQTNPAAQL